MKLQLPKEGKYVVAVSGGVDSVVLLDLLVKQRELELVVAHFDHGMRPDSHKDRLFVQSLAKKHSLPFEFANGKLGPDCSEEKARQARYRFLRAVASKHNALALITAHHQGDVIETVLLNLLRGTGRRGLSSLQSTAGLLRPLLETSKPELLAYAKRNGLAWREDTSNLDTKYKRNYIRHTLLPELLKKDPDVKHKLLALVGGSKKLNAEIEHDLELIIPAGNSWPRVWFNSLPHAVAKEVCVHYWKSRGLGETSRPRVEDLVVQIKRAKTGKIIEVSHGLHCRVGREELVWVDN